ncbi:hypothetical protein V501_02713 [Pseudogymnoascus sp. VKM F-4519 (FW-2642)]|nr:hypothetical protein V501_02713 [Pseudogymnoascus sp. VKM F-4519 (FW-2642)]
MSAQAVKEIEQCLDKAGEYIWHCDLGEVSDYILQRLSRLEAQSHVQRTLEKTAKLLQDHPRDKALPNQQATRVKHFIKFVFEKTTRGDERHMRLRKLDCDALKFCGLTYKIREVLELSAAQFDFLVENIGDYVRRHKLSEHLYRDDVDKAVHGKFDPEDDVIFKGFLKSHVELRPAKRKHNEVSDGDLDRVMSLTDGPPAADRLKEKAPSPAPLKKRRHIEDEQLPTVHTGELATGRLETEQLPTAQTGRQIDYKCSEAQITLMPLLGEPLFDAVAASNQWQWEREIGGPTTDCMNAMVPEDRSQDISITLSVGYEKGLEVIDKFRLKPT